MSRSYQGVAVCVPQTVRYQRYSSHGAQYFFGTALRQLLSASGLQKSDVDGMSISSFTLAPDTGISVAEHLGIELRWLDQLILGGASGVVSLKRAARVVQNGDAEVVACIGADTCNPDSYANLMANFSDFSTFGVHAYGAGGPSAVFALATKQYMETHGVTREDFGRLCISQRQNARHNPNALLGDKELTMEAYLGARTVAEPLGLFDCVMPCAGAEAFLVMSEERARSLQLPYARIKAAEEGYNAHKDLDLPINGGWCNFREALYAEADAGPEDIQFLQSYDDYPVMVFRQLEDLGFCEYGGVVEYLEKTDLNVEGAGLAHNTSGGQLSSGQAGFAGGFLGVTEGLRQLTGQVLGCQIADARIGMVSGFGMVNYDRGLCSAAVILEAGESS